MLETVQTFAASLGIEPRILVLAGLFIGSFSVLYGLLHLGGSESVISRRLKAGRPATGAAAVAFPGGVIRGADRDPAGLLKGFVPAEREVRTRIQRQLAQAGFGGSNAVRNFYLLRVFLGLVLPGALLGVYFFAEQLPLPARLEGFLTGLGRLQLFQILSVLIALGFYGPSAWLRARVAERQARIAMAFPNALDLLQISVEAGLGLDAAMSRVADELTKIAPEISQEIKQAERELLAGKGRDKAYLDMAERLGIDEATSFVNVILQSTRFGTSLSSALSVYAAEMRIRRELKAQEKANKLPVQMSAVMASLMLPALLIVTIGPVVIRYMRYLGG